ncbi:oxidoreductase [Pendulispora rubella]|uniref:Oxidoreductase n=1 Tax=Pendulispora rubella TaxID=2741070 RepID=A0ABZ2LHK7_9BACT
MSTPQSPIGSGFDAASTAADVVGNVDLTGKVAIVTGGASGIGVETVRALRMAGADVIVPARAPHKARTALAGLDGVAIEPMDLFDPASIDGFVKAFLASRRALHILVNSAGIMACPLVRDARGFESQFATNHLGHFQLTLGLWPALRKANGARVVSVSSWGHRRSPVVLDDPNFDHRDYDRWLAYGQSKTANVLFAVHLDRRGKSDGVRGFSVHPGAIANTGLGRYLSGDELRALGVIDEHGNTILDPSKQLKTVEQGASTSVWCATSPILDGMGGVYCENNDIASLVTPRKGGSVGGGVMPHAIDPEAAERLWALSECLLLR